MYIREHDHRPLNGALPLFKKKVKGEVELDVWGHGASEEAKAAALKVMTTVFGSLGPANVRLLDGIDVQLHIIPYGTKLTDLPEFSEWKGVTTDDGRLYDDLRGMGGKKYGGSILYAAGEETLVKITGIRQHPLGTVACHESAHVVAQFALTAAQKKRLKKIYDERKKAKGTWLRDYASTNTDEYFAEATCAFFQYAPSAAPPYGVLYTRDGLKANDLPMYQLLADIYARAL
jgi:hypothetical protein